MHCQHYNDKLNIGLASLARLSNSQVADGENILSCRTALVDLGLTTSDPGLAPAGAMCGHEKMCLQQKCVSIGEERVTISRITVNASSESVRVRCRKDCSGHGLCTSRGRCHCDRGWGGDLCTVSLSRQHTDSLIVLTVLLVTLVLILVMVFRRLSPLYRMSNSEDSTVLIEKSGSDEWHSRASHQLPAPRAFQL